MASLSVHTYHGSALTLLNPDRGFRHQFETFCDGGGLNATAAHALAEFNLSIAQCYCYLPASLALPSATLRALNASFATMRAAGAKALLRFAYDRDDPGTGDYTFEMIRHHIDQLAPSVHANADAIYVLQAGFIGAWGEWHGSKHKLRTNETGVSEMVARQLSTLLPLDRKMQVRVPEYKSELVLRPRRAPPHYGAGAAPPAMAFGVAVSADDGTAISRIGFDNDGFMSTSDDGGTWPAPNHGQWEEPLTGARLPLGTCGSLTTPLACSAHGAMVAPGFAYMQAESPYVPVDGEMYWNAGAKTTPCPPYEKGWPSVDGHTAAWRLRAMHYDTLSLVHGFFPLDGKRPGGLPNETISMWRHVPLNVSRLHADALPVSAGYAAAASRLSSFDYVRDHLGYRLELTSATFATRSRSTDEAPPAAPAKGPAAAPTTAAPTALATAPATRWGEEEPRPDLIFDGEAWMTVLRDGTLLLGDGSCTLYRSASGHTDALKRVATEGAVGGAVGGFNCSGPTWHLESGSYGVVEVIEGSAQNNDGYGTGVRASVSTDDGATFDLEHDYIVLSGQDDDWPPCRFGSGCGAAWGNTISLGDGALLTVYSYAGPNGKDQRVGVLEWRLPH